MAWAIKWKDASRESDKTQYFVGRSSIPGPVELDGCRTMLFATRKAARAYIAKSYSYIPVRPDLRKPPYNWRMPKAVRVAVTIKEVHK